MAMLMAIDMAQMCVSVCGGVCCQLPCPVLAVDIVLLVVAGFLAPPQLLPVPFVAHQIRGMARRWQLSHIIRSRSNSSRSGGDASRRRRRRCCRAPSNATIMYLCSFLLLGIGAVLLMLHPLDLVRGNPISTTAVVRCVTLHSSDGLLRTMLST